MIILRFIYIAFLHELAEEGEEGNGGHSGGSDIAHRLSQEHSKSLVRATLEEQRQNEDQGDQQNQLSQAGHAFGCPQ